MDDRNNHKGNLVKGMKKIPLTLGLVVLSLCVYYFIVILNARAKTSAIVQKALTSDRIKLGLDDLSNNQLLALLKVQDPNFYSHRGFDFSTPGTGATTISQALVKIYYFENFQSGIKKIEQTLIARFAFDNLTPKDTILKLFINEVYLGENNGQTIRGFENASLSYFKKSFKALTWDEYLSILAMIRAPMLYNYAKNRVANIDRVSKIKKMLQGEYAPKDNSDWKYDRMTND